MNQENVLADPHSSASKIFETNEDHEIERLEIRKGKRPLERMEDEEANHERKIIKQSIDDNDGHELGLAHEDLTIAPINPDGSSSRDIIHENNDLAQVPTIPAPQLDNQHNLSMNSLFHVIGRDPSIKSLISLPRYNYACIASLNRSFRELIRSGELYKLRRSYQVIEHWVYFSCQQLEWEAFDPTSEKWLNLPIMDPDIAFQLSDKESMAVGTELLVLGNDMLGPGIYKYNLLTNSWSQGLPMNEPRWMFGSASFKNIAIFAGGVDRNGKIMDTVESYDSETGTWKKIPSLIKPRKLSSGVFMDGKFYVIGGISSPGTNQLTSGEEYDLDAQKWTEIPNMCPTGSGPTMAPPLLAVASNELYAADCVAMELKIYNKNNKEWVVIGGLPEIAHNMDGWGIAFRGCGERIIIVCGPRTTGDRYIEIYSWVPCEGPPKWLRIGRKSSNNFVYNCAIMGC